MVRTQLTDHGAAEGVTDEDDPVQVERLEHRCEVGSEAARCDRGGTEGRASVAAQVDADHAEPIGEVEVLVLPGAVVEREPVHEDDGRATPAFDDVQLGAVVGDDRGRERPRDRIAEAGARSGPPVIGPDDEPWPHHAGHDRRCDCGHHHSSTHGAIPLAEPRLTGRLPGA